MLRSYAVFANGGYLVQPTLLKSKIPLKGVADVAPVRVLSPAAAAGVTEALLAVTSEGGTGLKANVEGYRVAGKTGTAQAVDPRTGRYSRSHYIGTFIGFPTGVEPKLVIFTLIDEPKGVYYASETAAPLFQAVLRSAANRFSLPTLPLQPGVSPVQLTQKGSARSVDRMPHVASGPVRTESAPVLEAVSSDDKLGLKAEVQVTPEEASAPSSWKMPDLRGLSAREALRTLQKGNFEVEVHGEGVVRSQVPAPGQVLSPGGHVNLRMEGP
jgi:membrane peptidoglycan carboxypeptidase